MVRFVEINIPNDFIEVKTNEFKIYDIESIDDETVNIIFCRKVDEKTAMLMEIEIGYFAEDFLKYYSVRLFIDDTFYYARRYAKKFTDIPIGRFPSLKAKEGMMKHTKKVRPKLEKQRLERLLNQ